MIINFKAINLRYIFALTVLSPLFFMSGCGFKPLYNQSNNYLNDIIIKPIDGRIGFLVSQELQNKIGNVTSSEKSNILTIKINRNVENSNLKSDYYTSRSTIIAETFYEYNYNGQKIQGSFISRSGFDAAEKAFSEVSLSADAEDRLAKEIAENIWQDLIIKTRQ